MATEGQTLTLAPADWWLVADTASPRMSLVLVRGSEPYAQWGVRSQRPSAHQIVADIAYLLERTGIQPAHLSAIGALVGPGSFTGIRVGLAALKGLAQPHNLPIATATTLEVTAAAVTVHAPTTVLVINISHRRDVHGQGFLVEPGLFPKPLTEPLTGPVEHVAATLAAHLPTHGIVIGDGLTLLDSPVIGAAVKDWQRQPPPPWLAPVAVPLLATRLLKGATASAVTLTACYARAPLPT